MIHRSDDKSREIRLRPDVVVGDHQVGGRQIDQCGKLRHGLTIEGKGKTPGVPGARGPEQQRGKLIGKGVDPKHPEADRRHPEREMRFVQPVPALDA